MNAPRKNGRGYRRREDREAPPENQLGGMIAGPHSLVVKAQNREALRTALKDQIKKTTLAIVGKTKGE